MLPHYWWDSPFEEGFVALLFTASKWYLMAIHWKCLPKRVRNIFCSVFPSSLLLIGFLPWFPPPPTPPPSPLSLPFRHSSEEISPPPKTRISYMLACLCACIECFQPHQKYIRNKNENEGEIWLHREKKSGETRDLKEAWDVVRSSADPVSERYVLKNRGGGGMKWCRKHLMKKERRKEKERKIEDSGDRRWMRDGMSRNRIGNMEWKR